MRLEGGSIGSSGSCANLHLDDDLDERLSRFDEVFSRPEDEELLLLLDREEAEDDEELEYRLRVLCRDVPLLRSLDRRSFDL